MVLAAPSSPTICAKHRAKAALNIYVSCLAKEEPAYNVVAVRPGVLKTDLLDAAIKEGYSAQEVYRKGP